MAMFFKALVVGFLVGLLFAFIAFMMGASNNITFIAGVAGMSGYLIGANVSV